MNAASSMDNVPRQRMPGVGHALCNVSEAFRRKTATASPMKWNRELPAEIRLKADPTFCIVCTHRLLRTRLRALHALRQARLSGLLAPEAQRINQK